MGAQMDRMMALTRYQVCRMKDLSDKFYLLEEDPQCVNVCFWYVPKRLRGVPMSKEKEMELGKVTIREYIFLTTVTLMKTIQLRIWFKKPSLALSNTTYYFGLSIFLNEKIWAVMVSHQFHDISKLSELHWNGSVTERCKQTVLQC